MGWFNLSVIGLLSLSTMSFLITFSTRKGYPVPFVLLGLSVVLFVFYFLQTFIFSSNTLNLSLFSLLILLIIGLLSAIGNFAIYQAANIAPNPGLAIANAGLQSVIVSFLTFIVFHDKLTPLQISGIILGIAAIFLINIGSKVYKITSKNL